jgi:hypothetical protein
MEGELSQRLQNALGKYDGFEARLRVVAYDWSEDDLAVSGTFVYPALDDRGRCTVDHLAQFLYWRIVPFCIPRREREILEERFRATGDYRHIHTLTDRARKLFVRAQTSRKSSGEPGELALFVLLESMLKAPQIACKMYLKTNPEVHVHGADSVHAMVGSAPRVLRLVWGEAKTYREVTRAVKELCASLSSFIDNGSGRSQRDHEIEIIREHVNITDTRLKDLLLEYLDPYSERSNEMEEMYACFIAFDDHALFSGLDAMPRDHRVRVMEERYKQAAAQVCGQFADELRRKGLTDHSIHLFLLPVPHVAEFRAAFFRHLEGGGD